MVVRGGTRHGRQRRNTPWTSEEEHAMDARPGILHALLRRRGRARRETKAPTRQAPDSRTHIRIVQGNLHVTVQTNEHPATTTNR